MRIDVGNAGMMALEVQPDGVMIPNRFCSGVNATDECGVRVNPGLCRR
jgi:hypothetical protein